MAKALDALQGEKGSYGGILLLILTSTGRKLEEMIVGSSHRPTFRSRLATWARDSLKRRVEVLLTDDLSQKASTLHPACRMAWLNSRGGSQQILADIDRDLEAEVEAEGGRLYSDTQAELESIAAGSDSINDLLCDAFSADEPDRGESRLEARLEAAKLSLRSYLSGQRLRRPLNPDDFPDRAVRALFIKYNTAMPSSASAERLFSAGKRVITYLRGNMHDSTIEGSLMVSVNSKLDYFS